MLFEDKALLVVNKPAGMCVHPAGGLVSGTLVNGLLFHFGHPAIIIVDSGADKDDGDDRAAKDDGGDDDDDDDDATASFSVPGERDDEDDEDNGKKGNAAVRALNESSVDGAAPCKPAPSIVPESSDCASLMAGAVDTGSLPSPPPAAAPPSSAVPKSTPPAKASGATSPTEVDPAGLAALKLEQKASERRQGIVRPGIVHR